jgi:hypothetical protein
LKLRGILVLLEPEHKAQRVWWAQRVQRVREVLPDHKEYKALQALQVLPDHKEYKERQVYKVLQVYKALQVLPDHKVYKE